MLSFYTLKFLFAAETIFPGLRYRVTLHDSQRRRHPSQSTQPLVDSIGKGGKPEPQKTFGDVTEISPLSERDVGLIKNLEHEN